MSEKIRSIRKTHGSEILSAVFDAVSEGIFAFDSDGTIIATNKNMELLFGYSSEKFWELTVEDLIPEKFREIHIIHREKFINDPAYRPMPQGLELYGRKNDGTDFPIEVKLSFAKIGDETICIGLVADISRRKSDEIMLRRAQTLAGLSLIAAQMAHMVKQPLSAIAADLDILKSAHESQNVILMEKIYHRLKDRKEKATAIIDSMLMVYRHGADSWGSPTDIAELMKKVIVDFGERFDKVKITFNHDSNVYIEGGSNLLGVFVNLIDNAIVAMNGAGEINISISSIDGVAVVTVEDSGGGVALEVAEKLFQPSVTTRRSGEVAGMGFFLARAVLEKMGGAINFAGLLGNGAKFVLTVPLKGISDETRH